MQAWCRANIPLMAFSPEQIIRTASTEPDPSALRSGGVYFLVWEGMIAYVGKAASLQSRLTAHQREGRPHQAVAVICGLPQEASATVENVYAESWHPPWNSAKTDGDWPGYKELSAKVSAMDQNLVMPHRTPRGDKRLSFMKAWQLHVLGWNQLKNDDFQAIVLQGLENAS